MAQNAYDSYLESTILSAGPVELTGFLYRASMEAVREARRCLADGEIAARSQAITKACSILMELAGALDHARGGAISQRLVQLYDYMQRRLLEANFMQSDAPLHEVLGLLATLSDAWNGVHQQAANSVENRWMPVPQEPPVEYSARAWSF